MKTIATQTFGWLLRAPLMLLMTAAGPSSSFGQQLTVTGAAGAPGDTVGMTIRLAGDAAGVAVSADLDVAFPGDLVGIDTPISASCRVAERLEGTHQVGGRLAEPGLLRFALFARGLEIQPLGDGELASCDFHVLADAAGASAPLTIEYLGLGDHMGRLIPASGAGGAIDIGPPTDEPTPAPTLCVSGCGAPATPTAVGFCAADCNRDGVVTVNELISSINIGLGRAPLQVCDASDGDGDSAVSIGDLIDGVGGALGACQR